LQNKAQLNTTKERKKGGHGWMDVDCHAESQMQSGWGQLDALYSRLARAFAILSSVLW